jgi:hypothetical protein
MGSNASCVRIGGDNSGTKGKPVTPGGVQMPRLTRAGQSKTGDNPRKSLGRNSGRPETLACSIKNR